MKRNYDRINKWWFFIDGKSARIFVLLIFVLAWHQILEIAKIEVINTTEYSHVDLNTRNHKLTISGIPRTLVIIFAARKKYCQQLTDLDIKKPNWFKNYLYANYLRSNHNIKYCITCKQYNGKHHTMTKKIQYKRIYSWV